MLTTWGIQQQGCVCVCVRARLRVRVRVRVRVCVAPATPLGMCLGSRLQPHKTHRNTAL